MQRVSANFLIDQTVESGRVPLPATTNRLQT